MKKGYCDLTEKSPVLECALKPTPLYEGYGYFNYGKYEPDRAALRMAGLLGVEKFPEWKGVSLRRFFIGDAVVAKKVYATYPAILPEMTEEQEEGRFFEKIPKPVEHDVADWLTGLSILRRLGVVEVVEKEGESYLLPTTRFVADLEKGIAWVDERVKAGAKA
ncbi:MAG: hypothetical protein HGA31_02050 [Candidatus Moranbacteria bacterium]|nr:hypothetical protein [Candidatus Moranbacteria bacterium]